MVTVEGTMSRDFRLLLHNMELTREGLDKCRKLKVKYRNL